MPAWPLSVPHVTRLVYARVKKRKNEGNLFSTSTVEETEHGFGAKRALF